jgi:hypothetical protein
MPDDQPVSDAGDIHLGGVGWGGAMVAGGIVFALVASYFAFRTLQPAHGYGGPDADAGMHIAGPVLETAPQPARASYAAEKERLINGYGWVDRKAGIARIPVEQAMRLMAGRAALEKGRAAR